MTCTESNIVEQMILDAVTKLGGKQVPGVRKDTPPYRGESFGDELRLRSGPTSPMIRLRAS